MTLHQELTDIILSIAFNNHSYTTKADEDNASEAVVAVIEKIVERLPEKKKYPLIAHVRNDTRLIQEILRFEGWNSYHDTLKDLLTEGETQ